MRGKKSSADNIIKSIGLFDSKMFSRGEVILDTFKTEKHIWKCEDCNARVKGLGCNILKPKKCPNCGGNNFS